MSASLQPVQKQPEAQGQGDSPKVIYFSLRWKLLLGFTLLFSVVFAVAFYWFYTFATRQALNRIQADLIDTLEGSSKQISADILLPLSETGQPNASGQAWLAVFNAEENETADAASLRANAEANFGKATPQGFSDDPRYQTLMDELEAIHEIEPRAWPYIYVKGKGEREITYIADLWARYNPSKATPFLFTKSSKRSFNGLNELTIRLDDNGKFTAYTDDWGQWVSAYMPIKDESGQSVGAVGIDFQADYVFEVQNAIRQRVAFAFFITYLSLFALVFLVSRTLTGPITELTTSAERLGEGDYEQDLSKLGSSGRFQDEIDTLANVFAIMTNKVYQREQTLRRQVEALKIEIDESKRQKQVDEIADTDFFKELQNKARNMRSRQGLASNDDSDE
jgi:HAMP domain-containing protein